MEQRKRGVVWKEVAAAVADLRSCMVSDLEPLFPNLTRYEVQNALSAARRAGLVLVIKRVPMPGNSARMGIWAPVNEEVAKRGKTRPGLALSCVFDLGTGPVAIPVWQQPARAFQPLGAWD